MTKTARFAYSIKLESSTNISKNKINTLHKYGLVDFDEQLVYRLVKNHHLLTLPKIPVQRW